MPSDASSADPPPTGPDHHTAGGPLPDLAWQIVEVMEEIGRLERRRGPEYRALLLRLWELCGRNARMVADLVGIREPSAWETIRRARQDRRGSAGV